MTLFESHGSRADPHRPLCRINPDALHCREVDDEAIIDRSPLWRENFGQGIVHVDIGIAIPEGVIAAPVCTASAPGARASRVNTIRNRLARGHGESPALINHSDKGSDKLLPVSVVCSSRTDPPLSGAQKSKKLHRLPAISFTSDRC